MALGVAFAAPASAQAPGPATQGSASAYGLRGSGLVTIAPTPSVSTGTPGLREQTAVPVDAGTVALNATLRARAECRVEPTVPVQIDATLTPPLPAPNNCDGYARTEGLSVLLEVAGVETPALVTADLIEGEAVARCVAGRGVLASGYNIVNLRIGGEPVALVEDTVTQVLDLVGADGPLAPVVTVTQNEVTRTADGIAVTALHVSVLPGGAGTGAQDIYISHAEARMPSPCGVAGPARPAAPANLGAGPVDAPLPRTGSNEMLAIPVAFGLLATALVLRQANRRARRANV
ncbi:MAG: hypothetical protein M3404_07500 [Actinomycetota bacterium]|nr:hypothetical protein [Actinomycetota bacterium]